MLVERVVVFQSHTNPTCRDWIRELRIEEFNYEDEGSAAVLQHLNLVHILIANASSLELFLDRRMVLCSTLMVLACTAAATLRTMVIELGMDNEVYVYKVLNSFSQLRRLDLSFSFVDDAIEEPWQLGVSQLCLPNLTHLKFAWPGAFFPLEVAAAMARCKMDKLKDICLRIPSMELNSILNIMEFLTCRAHAMNRLEIVESAEADFHILREVLLETFVEIKFKDCVPSPTFLDAWHPDALCRKLALDASLGDDDNLWPVFEFVD